jgi:hypothetical protein
MGRLPEIPPSTPFPHDPHFHPEKDGRLNQIIESLCYPCGMDDLIRSHRRWLKDSIPQGSRLGATGQSRGLPPPPAREPIPHAAECGHR